MQCEQHNWDPTEALRAVPASPGHCPALEEVLGSTSIHRAGASLGAGTSPCAPAQCTTAPPAVLGSSPSQGCPKGSLELSLELSAWLLLGLECEAVLELLPGVISLSCQAKQQSSGFVLQLCLPLRKGRKWQSGKLRDSTQAPDSHFPWLSPFSQPPHHLWLCLSGSSAHNSIALPGKFTALKSSVQRARGVGRGGQGELTWSCHTAGTSPCHPCLESSALHKHECKDWKHHKRSF